jgi:DNA-binding MurR/RpiR family transcriptional regulator
MLSKNLCELIKYVLRIQTHIFNLAKLVDIQLCTSSTKSMNRSAVTTSRIAQLNVIDILFTAVVAKKYDQAVHYLNNSREVIHKEFR